MKRKTAKTEPRILTHLHFEEPPDSLFAWQAWREGDVGGPHGYGATEEAAIANLLSKAGRKP